MIGPLPCERGTSDSQHAMCWSTCCWTAAVEHFHLYVTRGHPLTCGISEAPPSASTAFRMLWMPWHPLCTLACTMAVGSAEQSVKLAPGSQLLRDLPLHLRSFWSLIPSKWTGAPTHYVVHSWSMPFQYMANQVRWEWGCGVQADTGLHAAWPSGLLALVSQEMEGPCCLSVCHIVANSL